MDNFKIRKIIEKKRNGQNLTPNEIQFFIDSVVKSELDRAQIGAMLMAMYLKGLSEDEVTTLTQSMTKSGFVFNWPEEVKHLVVDKHSTGGVGDKISLILAPALAALGLKVPMISGRSLNHTGGTLDKLESIPGFRVSLNKEEIYEIVNDNGCCIVGQTDECVPADKILYACREITATVDSPSLIAASIVSKKLSEGLHAIVYDVKYGKGSVFSNMSQAEETARNLVIFSDIIMKLSFNLQDGYNFDTKNSAVKSVQLIQPGGFLLDLILFSKDVHASALLTSMENPLGRAIGNSVEVLEVVKCLKGEGPTDVMELTYALGCELLSSIQRKSSEKDGEPGLQLHTRMESMISSGTALKHFYNMIILQGVDPVIANELCWGDAESVLPKSPYETKISYDGEDGYIQEIDPLILANIWKEDFVKSNHPGVGLVLLKQVGDRIKRGDYWIIFYHQDEVTSSTYSLFRSAICVGSSKKEREPIIKKRMYIDENKLKRTVKEEDYFS